MMAVRQEDANIMKTLISDGRFDVYVSGYALTWSMKTNRGDKVLLLLPSHSKALSRPVVSDRLDSYRILIWAISNNHRDIVRYLSNIITRYLPDFFRSFIPIYNHKRHFYIIELLSKHIDFKIYGACILATAIKTSKTKLVKFLMTENINYNSFDRLVK